jgi:hypothetical protein
LHKGTSYLQSGVDPIDETTLRTALGL